MRPILGLTSLQFIEFSITAGQSETETWMLLAALVEGLLHYPIALRQSNIGNNLLYKRITDIMDLSISKIKRHLALDSKSYYRTYVSNEVVSPCNEQQVRDIISYNPQSVFEFGCGVGRILGLLKDKVAECYGIDISKKGIEIARKKSLNVDVGDETKLLSLKNYDIAYTSSVLDHIKDIDSIVKELKRIANKAIVIAETNTPVGKFYFSHDYESFGFVNSGYRYVSHNAKMPAVYEIWHWKKSVH